MDTTDDIKSVRRRNKTGWLVISDDETVRFLIDAVLDLSPSSEQLPISELASQTGEPVDEIQKEMELLEDLDVIEVCEDGTMFEVQDLQDSPVLNTLYSLNSAVNESRTENCE